MSVGIVMLVHTALDRSEQVVRHWAAAGCPVVVHVDKSVSRTRYESLIASLADLPGISFSRRFDGAWGTFGIVAATQSAAEQMLAMHPQVRHVYLASGSCLPLRPIEELIEYLAERPRTDFIESVTTADVPWTVGGLDSERFTLRFPFSWKRQRFLFNKFVTLQRFLGTKRQLPRGLVPHMGSQWWCLTRQTLSAILQDPARATYDRFFRSVWIPDESYFQTMARKYAINIESRSLTLSKFDYQGKPHVFYDDHLPLLRRSDCFVARKVWPHADQLYDAFLNNTGGSKIETAPNPGMIDRVFSKAVVRRTQGRDGLTMQSRFPRADRGHKTTAAPYSVFQGFAELFENFETWLARVANVRVHGHLFAPDGAHFSGGQDVYAGAMSNGATLRDHDPNGFLTNLIWNTRGEHQCFQFGPTDNQAVNWRVAKDENAHISVISGAWAIPLFRSNMSFDEVRQTAARLQKVESDHLDILRSPWVRARVRIWTLAEFVDEPIEPLMAILEEIGPTLRHKPSEVPRMVDLTGFGQFLQNLRNQGMHPHVMGDFPVDQNRPNENHRTAPKPYLVR